MHKNREEIEAWLLTQFSQQLGVDSQHIDVTQPFTRYGLDSIVAAELISELEEWLGQSVPETLMWDEPTISDVARYLSGSKEPAMAAGLVAQHAGAAAHMAPKGETVPLSSQFYSPEHKKKERPSDELASISEPIAIIGLACRLPGARNAEAFWRLLYEGVDAISEVPPDRWEIEHLYDPDPTVAGKMTSRWGGFLTHIDLFDPYFFHISPREATHMDPQQRLLLEVAWEALENAGQAPDRLAGSQTGVFVGASTNDYGRAYTSDLCLIDAYTNTGNAHSITASRLSYLLDLHGPSIAIDTACSSSLVAIHLACQSLRSGEATLALAGGVNIMLSPEATIGFSKARMMSAQGCCKPFDANADGLVRGEGCGVVVLKRASAAYADGDRILALIRGSATNQDGRSNGLAAPNGLAQQAVIKQALRNAGLASEQLGYVVAQGTGTPLGDAVEFQALKTALGEPQGENHSCALSSVKANIGHLEAAAGVISLIAAVMALQYESIPPQLHFQQPNPQISLEQTPLFIPVQPERWTRSKQPRFAGVSAFSFSGMNAHLILEEPPPAPTDPRLPVLPLHLLALSACNERALKDLLDAYERYVSDSSTTAALPDICATANAGRAHFTHRVAVLADTHQQLLDSLRAAKENTTKAGVFFKRRAAQHLPRLAFLCSGEGTEYTHMGRQLYETQVVFRDALDQCAALLETELEQSLLSVLYPAPRTHSALREQTYTQSALFALEYAQARLWQSWGVAPDAVAGYGAGAYVAACLAGALHLDDALKLVAERGRLWQMLLQTSETILVHASENRVNSLLAPYVPHVSITAIYAPDRVLVSCAKSVINEVASLLSASDILTSSLPFRCIPGSSVSTSLLDAFERVANLLTYEPLSVPFICTTTGQCFSPGERLDARYWKRHMSGPTRFVDSINALSRLGCTAFLELGPSALLSELGANLETTTQRTWMYSLSKEQATDWQGLLEALGSLYTSGRDINWSAFHENIAGGVISLPTYPFQRERYWISAARAASFSPGVQAYHAHPLLGQRVL